MPETRHSVCALDCPDCCAIKLTVDATGHATRIQGDPAHPITKGFLCAKVSRYLDRQYHADRLLYPMKRTGPKGSGEFTRISWDEALDTVSGRLRLIATEYGSESVLPYSYGGNLGYLNGSGMDRRFFHRLGASQLDRTICASAGSAGLMQAYGARKGLDPELFAQSKLIIAWGANVMGTNVHLWPFIVEARRQGAQFYTIDPIRNRTGHLSDRHFFVNPGSDLALALGMLHVIFREGLEDRDYMERYTENAESLRAQASPYTPDRTSELTGIAAEDIVFLARAYATTKPAAIRTNYGVQRSQWGATAVRMLCLLPVVCGHWRLPGGGLQLSTSGGFDINREALERPDFMMRALGRPARMINMSALADALSEPLDPPVKALFVYNSNPAGIAPDQNRIRPALLSDELFTVVSEQFMTDTAQYADILLPATTFLENEDLYFAYGHYYLQHAKPALAAPGECKSNHEMFSLLGQRMGFGELAFHDSPEQIIRDVLAQGGPHVREITYEQLTREHSVRVHVPTPFLPYAEGGFQTSTGKVNLHVETEYAPPVESRLGDETLRSRYPLELVSSKLDDGMNSTFGHRAALDQEAAILRVHPGDAAARQIVSGDEVELFNERGRVRLTAQISPDVHAGVVAARGLSWTRNRADRTSINVLTGTRLTDFGGGATFYNCLVELKKCDA